MKSIKIITVFILALSSINVSSQIVYFDEDFSSAYGTNAPAGWSQNILVGDPAIDSFHFDNPSSRTLNSPITSPAAIFDSDGYSSSGGAEEVALISLNFDASSATNVTLEWDQYFKVYNANTVYVRVDNGVTIDTVYSINSATSDPDAQSIDISASAAGFATVNIQFLWTGDWSFFWIIDNVRVFTDVDSDVGVTAITAPVTGIALSASETVTVDVSNFGLLSQDSIPVSYRINGGPAVTDTLFTAVLPGNTVSFSFPTTADLSTPGNYLFDAWTSLGADALANNDSSFNYSVDNIPVIADVGVVGLFSPQSGFNLSNSEIINMLIRNFGNVTLDTIPVSYTLDAGAPVSDTLFGAIAPGETKSVVFSIPVDLSTVGSYAFEAWTSLLADVTFSNDSSIISIEHYSSPAPNTFLNAYGNGNSGAGYSVQVTSDGGYIVYGQTLGFNYDLFAIRTDVNGDTLWNRRFDGGTHDYANSVVQTADGGFAFLGQTYGFGAGNLDIFLIKTDANGDTLWTRAYGGPNDDEGNSIQQTADGGYIITGMTRNFGAALEDVYLIKTDAGGNILWSKIYSGSGYETGKQVRQTMDGGYIITGETSTYGAGSDDVFLVKTNALGDTLWTKTYGSSGSDRGKDVRQTDDGGYIVTGYASGFGGGNELYLIKTDAVGDTLWTRIYGANNTDPDIGTAVLQTATGYIVAGITQSFTSSRWDAILYNVDNNGDPIWTNTYGGVGNEEVYSLEHAPDGGYILTGAVDESGMGNYDLLLIKVDSNGASGSCFQQAVSPLYFGTPTVLDYATFSVISATTITSGAAPTVASDYIIINTRKFDIGLASTDPLCTNASNGTASVVSYTNFRSGADTAFSWSNGFSGGATAWNNINLAQGTYSVTVTSYNGNCTAIDSITLVDPPLLTTTTSQTDVSCSFGGDGTASIIPLGGTPPYNYNWINGQTDSTAINLFAGTYSVNVFDVNGCVANNLVVISQPNAMTATVSGTNASCNGGIDGTASLITSGGTLPYTYSWSNGDTTQNISGLTAGTYSVFLTDSCGAVINDSVTISEPSTLVLTASQINISCNGVDDGSASVSITGGVTPYTYAWSTSDTTANISGLDTGSYTVSVTDACGLSIADTVIITEPLVLSTTVSSTSASCNGLGDGTATVTPSGGTAPYNYLWNVSQQTATAIGLFAGTYGINVFDANGCLASNSTTVGQPDALNLQINVTDASCNTADGVAAATVTGGVTPYIYAWSSGGSSSTDTALVGGNYSLLVTDTNGCMDSTTLLQEICIITVDSTSTKNVVVWEKPVVTNIDSFRIYRDIVGTYTWVGSLPYGVESYFTDSTIGVNPMVTSYRYKVATLDACGNESEMGSYHETIHVQTTNNGTTVDLLWDNYEGFNFGFYRILRDSTGLGGANWVAMDSVTNANFTYTDINPPQIGANYLIEVVPAAVCEAKKVKNFNSSKSNTSSVSGNTTLSGTISSTDASVGGCDGTATVTVTGGSPPLTYAWDGGTNFQTTATASGLCAGMYFVTVTDAFGNTIALSVAVGEAPITGLQATTSATESSADTCNGTATVSPTGGTGAYTYLWDGNAGGQTTAMVTGLCPGTYSVVVTDSLGNEVIVFATVGVLPGILEFDEGNEIISVYPNPYKGETSIKYELTSESKVVLEVINVLGEHVTTLVDAVQTRGEYAYSFSAQVLGSPAGVYIILMKVDGRTHSKRIIELL
ncbi:MAG TPA: T9SS type A sorting domain-containing protein [Flavobacteriales bacterium]|nr:T9SS type A sorting domain-containing protein [Flavobacteriales bacterium]